MILVTAGLALTLISGSVAIQEIDSLKQFQLFTKCSRVALVVESLNPDAEKIGLTKAAIQNAVESRLRASRLYSSELNKRDRFWLYVNVSVVDLAFNTSVEFNKTLLDPLVGAGSAITWSKGSTGTHGQDSDFILARIARHMDEFLVEYLRVNEESCASQ